MLDDQKVVYETALSMSREASVDKKQVLIVKGGPGTGKSVVAINLLAETTQNGLVSRYVSKMPHPARLCRQTYGDIKEEPNLQYVRRLRDFL